MNRSLSLDAEARRVACTEFARPVVLRAGAGTGKTATLVARMVVWATGAGWDRFTAQYDSEARTAERVMSGIVAITFTEAAAAEMAERVAEALHELAMGHEVKGLPEGGLGAYASSRADHLLKALDHLQVRTIHAYCRGLLARFPIEAKLHPNFQVDAQGENVAVTVREAVEQHLSEWLSEESADVLELFALGITPSHIEDAVRSLVAAGVTEVELTANRFDTARVDAWMVQTRNAIHSTVAGSNEAFHALRAGNATKLLAGLEAVRDALRPGLSIAEAQDLVDAHVPSNLLAHLAKAWSQGNAGKAESAAMELCSKEFAVSARSTWHRLSCLVGIDESAYRLSASIVQPILETVRQRLRAEGTVVFAELLKRAATLVKNPGVARAVHAGTDQLFVDEFQDTDEVQCELIRHLALRGPVEGRPGLFLVGDPKQSIYGWRSADLRAYEGFVSEVLESGGVEHGLVQNFRSTRPILDEVDALMTSLMRPADGVQPAYESLVAARGEGTVEHPVCMWMAWDSAEGVPNADTGVARGREIEAEALAVDLSRLRAEGCDLAQVGVLFRSMTDIGVYQRALRAHGIPHEVTKDRNYFRRREVVEAAALVRAVLDPFDTLGFLGFIRSTAIGVPATALIPLWIEGMPRLWADLGSEGAVLPAVEAVRRAAESLMSGQGAQREPSPAWADRLTDAVVKVDRLRTLFDTVPFGEWLGLLRCELLPDVHASIAYQGTYRVANLEQFFRNLTGVMEATGGDTTALLQRLREAVSRQQEAEEARPDSQEGVVRLMTIHKSKGLAFHHTYIMDLHHGLRPTSRPSGTVVDGRWGVQLFGYWPLGFDAVWRRSEVVSEAERIRLVYVAMTRARDRLVLSGTWPTELRGPVRAKMLADLWASRVPALPNFLNLAEEADDSGRTVSNGIEWTFLGCVVPAESNASRTSAHTCSRGAIVDPQRHIDARSQMMRPLLRSPSSALGASSGEGRPIEAGRAGSLGSKESMVVGTVVHRMFELFPRTGPIDPEDLHGRFEQAARVSTGGRTLSAAAHRRGRELMEALTGGNLLRRFENLENLGMEVPILLRSDTADGPVVGWSGTIDMLCRDGATGAIRVVDFKTTALKGRTLQSAAEAYAEQGRVYVDGVRAALKLSTDPAFEVWFIEADDWVELPRD